MGLAIVCAGAPAAPAAADDTGIAADVWGANDRGQLGLCGAGDAVTPQWLPTFIAVHPGRSHTLATAIQGGALWAWGANDHGQLGDGDTMPAAGPVQVRVGARTFAPLSSGYAPGDGFSVVADAGPAAVAAGAVWAWGRNDRGQLGDGTTVDRYSPVQVRGMAGISSFRVAAGGAHSLLADLSGNVWAWGAGDRGQIGDGARADQTTPTELSGLGRVVEVAAGTAHSLALANDGTVWAWGAGDRGQIGDGGTADRTTPVRVGIPGGALSVAAGGDHSLAVARDETVWAWGANEHGQLGDGTTTDRPSPVQVAGLTGVSQVAAGDSHSLAVNINVAAWGANDHGQLGDGTRIERHRPVAVLGMPKRYFVGAGGSSSTAEDPGGHGGGPAGAPVLQVNGQGPASPTPAGGNTSRSTCGGGASSSSGAAGISTTPTATLTPAGSSTPIAALTPAVAPTGTAARGQRGVASVSRVPPLAPVLLLVILAGAAAFAAAVVARRASRR